VNDRAPTGSDPSAGAPADALSGRFSPGHIDYRRVRSLTERGSTMEFYEAVRPRRRPIFVGRVTLERDRAGRTILWVSARTLREAEFRLRRAFTIHSIGRIRAGGITGAGEVTGFVPTLPGDDDA
jgi:hypothetical protein